MLKWIINWEQPGNVKSSPYALPEGTKGNGGTALLIRNLGTSQRFANCSTPRHFFFSWKRPRNALNKKLSGPEGHEDDFGYRKIPYFRRESNDRSSVIQTAAWSLNQLRYPTSANWSRCERQQSLPKLKQYVGSRQPVSRPRLQPPSKAE